MNAFSPWKHLENAGAPTRGRAKIPPLRRLRPIPPMIKEVHIPAWNWRSPAYDRTATMIEVDRTAAWISAASSVLVAHGALEQTGPIPWDHRRAGYWQVDFTGLDEEGMRYRWARKDYLMSPLGTGHPRLKCWLAHPTVRLLFDLADTGDFAPPIILDTWTSDETVRLTKWSDGVQAHRLALMDGGEEDQEELEAFKLDYARMVQMLLTGEGFDYRRPDWYHAILAQHASIAWRDLYGTVLAGHGPVAAHEVDAAFYLPEDYDALTVYEGSTLKIDLSGRKLGTWKIKKD